MESQAASAIGLFFGQYGLLGAFILALLSLAGLFTWLWLRTSKELRQDNQGKITSQATEIDKLKLRVDHWRDKYYNERARRVGLPEDEDDEDMELA